MKLPNLFTNNATHNCFKIVVDQNFIKINASRILKNVVIKKRANLKYLEQSSIMFY